MIHYVLFLLAIWLWALAVILCILGTYLGFVILSLRRPVGIAKNELYRPTISFLIAVFNESEIITRKLLNIEEASYPKNLIEVFVVDGASTDGTPEIAEEMTPRLSYKLNVIREEVRDGKVRSLNRALKKCNGEIIVESDADGIVESDSLPNLVSNFADRSIGAVTGFISPVTSHETATEKVYRDVTNTFRIAESRFSSTFIFHGTFSGFRRSLFSQFDVNCDDSGTALGIIVKGYRAVEDESAIVHELLPSSRRDMFRTRTRRARSVVDVILSATRQFKSLNGSFKLVVLFNFLLHLVVPLLMIPTVILLPVAFYSYPPLLLIFPVLGLFYLFPRTRPLVFASGSYLLSQLALLRGLILYFSREKLIVWTPAR
jgi:poly-beta-1,6-N-acetyl-D-glucosamine synthase